MSPTSDTGCAPTTADVRNALDTMLGSENFARSPKISRLLTYLVEKKIAGDSSDLKEVAIATGVFDQLDDFNPRNNPIVRVNASRLRNLLRLYYAGAGIDDPVRIKLPDVGYAPDFERAPEKNAATVPEPDRAHTASAGKTGPDTTTSIEQTAEPSTLECKNERGLPSCLPGLGKVLGRPTSVAFVLANLVIACAFAALLNRTNVSQVEHLIAVPEMSGLDKPRDSLLMLCSRDAGAKKTTPAVTVYPVAIGKDTVFCRPLKVRMNALSSDPA